MSGGDHAFLLRQMARDFNVKATMQYFKKELPFNPIYDASGDPIKFEPLDRSIGFLATDNEKLIEELKVCVGAHRGGVLPSTKEEYEDFLKKKPSSPVSNVRYREELGGGVAGDTLTSRVPQPAQTELAPPAVDDVKAEEPQEKATPEPPKPGKRAAKTTPTE